MQSTPPAENQRSAPRWWLPGLAALALLGAAIAIACSALVFPYMSSNSDEGAYLSQARSMVHGNMLLPVPNQPQSAFLPWLAVRRGNSFVYKFTPAHAGVLALSDGVFGSAVPALAAIAAADLVLVALLVVALGGSHRAGLGAGALLALSPAWVIQSGTYLPYLSSAAVLLAAAVCTARGASSRRSWWFVLAGAAWGVAFFGRQYDAVLMLVPLAFIMLRGLWRDRSENRGELLRTGAAFALGAAPFIVLLAAYDHLATGAFARLPFNLLERSDTVGFGRHRVQRADRYLDYTPKAAVHATILNGLDVLRGVAGSALLVGIAAYGLLRDRNLPGRFVYLVIGLAWTAGYFLFWGSYAVTVLSDINSYLGPIYYLPAMVAALAAAAVTLDRLAQRHRQRAAVLAGAVVAVSVVLAVPLLANNLRRTDVRRAVAAEVNHQTPTGKRSLLLVTPARGPFVGHPLSWLRNQPDYGGDRLVAVHDAVTDFALIDQNRDRTAYLVSLINLEPVPAVRARVEPINRFRSRTVALRITGPALQPGWRRAINVGRDATREQTLPTNASIIVVEVTAGPNGLSLSYSDGAQSAPLGTPRPASAVSVRFRDTDPRGRVHTCERRVPVRFVDGQTEVLAPGQLLADGLSSPLQVQASTAPGG